MKNKPKNLDGNKLIADFDGLLQDSYGKYFKYGIFKAYNESEFKYHESYEWLMPVVERIKELKHPVNFYQSLIQNTVEIYSMVDRHYIVRVSDTIEKPITILWLAVVEFIEWFNKQENDKKGNK